MKYVTLMLAALLTGAAAHAQEATINVDKQEVQTVKGIGGWVEARYAFAKGDKVHLHYSAGKQLDRAMAVAGRMNVLGRVKGGKSGDMDFTMPNEGMVTFRWISDRGGVNNISYEVSRVPASADTRSFNSKTVEGNNAMAQ